MTNPKQPEHGENWVLLIAYAVLISLAAIAIIALIALAARAVV
jgi:hypothetical protein